MTDFQKLLRAITGSAIIVAEPRRTNVHVLQRAVAQSPIQVNPREAALLNNFAPNFHVSAGLRTARLDKVENRNGRTVGFYSIICRNPVTGMKERYAWRYGVWNGVVTLEKTYETSAR